MTIAQHGSGFVGSAMVRAIQQTCPNRNPIAIDIVPAKLRDLRPYGVTTCTPDQVHVYQEADVHLFSIPTPAADEGSEWEAWGYDLTYLTKALSFFAEHVLAKHGGYKVIVIRSTLYPGTTKKVLVPLLEKKSGKTCGKHFDVVMQPEFLEEANALHDALHPPLIAFAASSDRASKLFREAFAPFGAPYEEFETYAEAEWLKLANNTLNTAVIAFMNETRRAMVESGMDPAYAENVTRTLGKTAFANTRPSYGMRDFGPADGHCLPKDSRAQYMGFRARGLPSEIIEAVVASNEKALQALHRLHLRQAA